MRRDPRTTTRLSIPEQAAESHGDKGNRARAHAAARAKTLSKMMEKTFLQSMALVGVFAVIAVTFISSLSVYLRQQHDIAVTQQQIAEHSAAVSNLQDEMARWDDPAYVKAQARDRLGWVMPGETGYHVVDADGKVLGGLVAPITGDDATATRIWYEAVWGSFQAADRPEVSAEQKTVDNNKVIGPDSEPTGH